MNEFDYKKILVKNLWWLGLIVIAAVWFRFDINYNTAFPLENATMLKGKLLLNGEGGHIIHDNYSLPIFTLIFSFGNIIASRIMALILSLFMLFFFYKFVDRLFNDKLSSIFGLIFFALQAPVIFLGKFSTVDIISLTFFSIFLMITSEIITIDDSTKKVPFINIPKQYFCPVTASLFFILAGFSNYIVFIYLIPAFIIILLRDKKSGLYFLLTTIILTILIYFLNSTIINHQINSIIQINSEGFKFSKLLVRIAEYIAIPLMIAYSTLQILWKTSLKSTWVYYLILSSLLLPFYIILSEDVYNIYRMIPFSLILITPLCGLVISKFVMINPNYKYATIFAMFFIVGVSYWHLTKLEDAYPKTDSITSYCKEYFNKSDIIYCEDPYLISNYFYPNIDINNFKNIYYYNSKFKNSPEYKENIISQIDNGTFDYVILNGLFHKEFTEVLKKNHLKQKYSKIMTSEFKINSLMYPIAEEENYFEIYKIQLEYKLLRKFLASKK